MAFPQVAAENGGGDTTGTSHTVNLPSGIEAGDLLLVLFCAYNNPTITFPEGWTLLFQLDKNSQTKLGAWYRIADGEEGATINVTTSGSTDTAHTSYRITDYSGVPENASPTSGSSTTPDPPSLTPSWGALDTLWLAVCGFNAGSMSTYPTNYTDGRNDRYDASNENVASARRELNASPEDPGTFTIDSSRSWVASTIAIKEAPDTYTKTVSITALLKETDTKTVDVDAYLKDQDAKTVDLDTLLQATGILKTVDIDALLALVKQTETIDLDALLKALGITKAVAIDILLKDVDTKTVELDTLLALVKLTQTVDIDIFLEKTDSKTVDLDTYLRALNVLQTVDLDALIQTAGLTKEVALDALLATVMTETIDLDVLLHALGVTKTVALDALLKEVDSKTVALDVLIEALNRVTIQLDVILRAYPTGALGYTIEIRNSSGDLLAILENAFGISYDAIINSPHMLGFLMPAVDSKVSNIILANEIWLRDYDTGVVMRKFKLQAKKDARG